MRTDRAPAGSAGRVSRLWRYPVKSMLGEELESSEVVSSGLLGNRSYALIDVESSLLVSAKAPMKWGKMLECRSRLLGDGAASFPPPVQIVLPGGEHINVPGGDSGRAEAALSALFGRRVKLVSASAGSGPLSIEQYHPKIEEDPDGGIPSSTPEEQTPRQGPSPTWPPSTSSQPHPSLPSRDSFPRPLSTRSASGPTCLSTQVAQKGSSNPVGPARPSRSATR